MAHIKLLCDIGELTEIFTESYSIESFLQKIVVMVANHMKVDVCSVYIYDESNNLLTLKATQGLNPASIGKVKLNLGEGLVGLALKERRPICEAVGSSHQNFKFIDGLFEERYEAFLAVPILRGISKIGVLVIQRQMKNCFKKENIMAMRVVASQLAGVIEQARLIMTPPGRHAEPIPSDILQGEKFTQGKVASEGFALGQVTVLDKEKYFELFEQKNFKESYTLEDFSQAVSMTEEQLETLQKRVEERLSDVASLIFTAHLLILKDKEFTGRMEKLIKAGEAPPDALIKIVKKYLGIRIK